MTDSIVKFPCPQCGENALKVNAEPKDIADFEGAVCTACGHTISVDDIKAHAVKIATELLSKGLKF
ncbi:ECs_2282 family putative zinc-binding protein [Burkholderia multivorans]|uniref:ECs_2282 family putative zinc-binding protein n=1 Tax=Burkholderia multivorans TaxID=87883 RepID=UPI003BF5FFB7